MPFSPRGLAGSTAAFRLATESVLPCYSAKSYGQLCFPAETLGEVLGLLHPQLLRLIDLQSPGRLRGGTIVTETVCRLPSFSSSFTDSFKVRWPWSSSSHASSSTGSQSSWASESSVSQASSGGARRRKSIIPQSSNSHSRETSQESSFPYQSRENHGSSSSRTSETESFPSTYQESSYASQQNRHERSDESYGQSFTISSRLKRAILAPTKLQTAIGSIILIVVVASIVLGLVLGLRNISLQDNLRNRINTIPVRIPNANESVIGHIKGEPPQKREFSFVIDERLGFPDGVEKAMIVANGQYPGPIIEVNQGDEVIVNVKNNLAQPTSIHWQGLFQFGTNYFDGLAGVTECGIPAGEQMSYRLQPGPFTGTTFWKAGYGTQAADGLTGGLVVHPTHSNTTVTFDEEVVVHLSDLYHENSKVLTEKYISAEGIGGKAGNEPVPDSGTINGIGQYPHRPNGEIIFPEYHKLHVEKTKSYRLRLINAGSMAPIVFSVDNHNLTVIEADGVEVEPITFIGGIQVEVGQRYSVVLHAEHDHHEQYWMRAALVADGFKYDNPESNRQILGIVAYGEGLEGVPHSEAHEEKIEILDPTRLRPLVPTNPPPATQTYMVDYLLRQSPGGSTVGMFNSTTWVPLLPSSSLLTNLGDGKDGLSVPAPYQFLLSADKPEVIDLIINNWSGGSSTFSLSGHRPWIIGSGKGNYHGDRADAAPSPANMTGSTPNGLSTGSAPDNTLNDSTPNGPPTTSTTNDSHGNSIAPSTPSTSSNSTMPNPKANQPGGSSPAPNSTNFSNPEKDRSQTAAKNPEYKQKDGTSSDHSKSYTSPSKKPSATRPATSSPRYSKYRANMHELNVHEPYKGPDQEKWAKGRGRKSSDNAGWTSHNKRDNNTKSRRQLPKSDNPVAIQRDTFTIPKDGWVKIRFPTDNPGMWLLSDQIQWHLAAGGAMQISSRKAEWAKVPDEVQRFCSTPEKLI
ncbi:hypothetical protein PGTUg99_019718 [Puccinia graminis f. sp. tritici]|uniref:Plastocyanin-like domain-containing protein n=1 Tax=Puccinia graminis f. sp. tritici TaxID=56615 RepID=A0A5B0MSJ0_PUCGR|nr:hypothetical protein PGTUg99_019718 [Puccinia graminis f. sp. tritici]